MDGLCRIICVVWISESRGKKYPVDATNPAALVAGESPLDFAYLVLI